MNKLHSILIVLLLVTFSQAQAATPVNAYELRLYLEGRTAECVKTKDDSVCDTYFAKGGEIKRYTYADKKRRTGTWKIDAEGVLHVHWKGKKKALTFTVGDRGDGTLELVRKGKVKSIILSAQPGNQLGW